MRLVIRLLAVVILLGGCASPRQRAVDAGIDLASDYARQPEVVADVDAHIDAEAQPPVTVPPPPFPWWQTFDNAELNALVTRAFVGNPGLNQLQSRLQQAAARARVSYSELLPSLDLRADRSAHNGNVDLPSTFGLRGAAGYELDVWGGNRADYQANLLEAQASAQDIEAAAITLSGSIVENWLRLLAAREEEALLVTQIETNEMVLDLQLRRYEKGVARALDVLQQQEILERARAAMPDIKLRQELITQQLAILVGQTPAQPLLLTGNQLPPLLPLPASGVPAQLLENRPDIQAAWLRVTSSDWASEVARVSRLPGFDISADYVTGSTSFSDLFDTWALDLAFNLTAPLYDGGARAAEQARREALADERFQAYRQTVLAAIGEVEGALSQNHFLANRIRAVENQLAASRNTLEQAQISYSSGDESYLSVLSGLINVQTLEQQLVRERRQLAISQVDLVRAIGPYTGDPLMLRSPLSSNQSGAGQPPYNQQEQTN